jgi:hypothetical protein
MKHISLILLMTVGIAGPFAAQLGAQSNAAATDIPFDFIVSKHTLPAGRYEVQQWPGNASLFALRDHRGHGIFVQLANNERGNSDQPSVTFACYGKDCVLAKITPPHSDTAYGLSRNSIEKNLHHTLGMSSMVSIKLGR